MSPLSDRFRLIRRGLLAATLIASAVGALGAVPSQAASVTLNETGSTLLYPLFRQWIPDYAKVTPDVTVTAAATGSGAGIAGATSGKAQIGASDAYMPDALFQQSRGIVNIPVAISAQTVNYNIPGSTMRG